MSLYFASQGASTVACPVALSAVRLVITVGCGWLAMEHLDLGFSALPSLVASGMMVFGLGTALSIYAGAWRRAVVVT